MTRDHLIERLARQQAVSTTSAPGKGRVRAWSGRRRVTLAALASVAMLIALGVATLAGSLSYTIQWGDTLGDLAYKHGTDVATLASANGIENPDLIIAGDELVIPSGEAGADATTYVVQDGDTLSKIGRTFDVTVEELAAANGLDNVDLIVTGDVIVVPAATGDGDAAEETGAAGDDAGMETDAAEPQPEEPATTEEEGVDAEPPAEEGDGAAPISYTGEGAQLHLVSEGETIEQIAEMYGVTAAQISAANALDAGEVAAGMILKVPPAGTEGIILVGMPAAAEQWPLQSELAAASVAASYWGEPVAASAILELIESSENPHLGFRGNPQGMWGGTEDYGVYNEALAEALTGLGFTAEAFYADGDPSQLTSRLDAGTPVVVWVTYGLAAQERMVIETETGRYSLIPEKHALVAYGYDDAGIWVVDVSDGQYKHYAWDQFLASWSLFDGMGLAISLE